MEGSGLFRLSNQVAKGYLTRRKGRLSGRSLLLMTGVIMSAVPYRIEVISGPNTTLLEVVHEDRAGRNGRRRCTAETVAGAILAAREYAHEVVLVGQPDAINAELAKADTSGLALPIEPAATVIPMDEHQPSTAWRRQRDSSLSVALQMLADHKVDAVVSAGNTGAVVSGGTFILRRISGFDRPALGIPFPAMGDIGKVFLADVGATPDAKAAYLVQWARMGAIYTERVLGIKNPRVALCPTARKK